LSLYQPNLCSSALSWDFASSILQDLDFLAFMLPQIEILMPTKKPRGRELTLEQKGARQTYFNPCKKEELGYRGQ